MSMTKNDINILIQKVRNGTYTIENALEEIAAAAKGNDVRAALYALAYTLNKEGKSGSVDLIARNRIDNLVKSGSLQLKEHELIIINCPMETSPTAKIITNGSDAAIVISNFTVEEAVSGVFCEIPEEFEPLIPSNVKCEYNGVTFVFENGNLKYITDGTEIKKATIYIPYALKNACIPEELQDIRVGADGTVYENAGEAVRSQFSQLSEEIGKQTGTGLSTEAIDKLEEVGKHIPYTTAEGGSKWTELISILRNGSSGGGSGESGEIEVTLSSISATYTGGDVAAGTSVNDLTGITVTATYSDGSTSNVTEYALSGTIAEGSNTITVSYDGKTTTFTVTDVNESGGEPVIYSIPNVATEHQTGYKIMNGSVVENSIFQFYVIENVKAGDIVQSASTNSDKQVFYVTGDGHLAQTSGSYVLNYSAMLYTHTFEKDYDKVWVNAKYSSTGEQNYEQFVTWTKAE